MTRTKPLLGLVVGAAALVAVLPTNAASVDTTPTSSTIVPPPPVTTLPVAALPTAPALPTVPTTAATGPVTTPTLTLPDVGLSTLAPTTTAAAAPQPTALEFRATPPLGIPLEVGAGPQYVPTGLLPPSDQQGWLMFGDYRSNPGAVSQVVAYGAAATSPNQWGQVGFTGEERPSTVRDAVPLADGRVLVLGSIDHDAGPAAAAWVYDDGTFSAPESPRAADSLSRVTHATVAADGTVYAVVERYVARQAVTFELAKRAPAGTWSVVPIDIAAVNIGVYGLAVSGPTVVLSGDVFNINGVTLDAAVFASLDGGITFQLADLSALRSVTQSTYVSDVVTGGPGFLAAACLEGPGVVRSAVLQSADGLAWSELAFTGPDGFPLVGAGCDEIAVDPEGGIWLAGATTFEATYYRIAAGAVDRVAILDVSGQQGPILNARAIRFGVDGTTLAMSVPQSGGTAAGFVPTASANVTDPYQIEPVGDAPTSHEIIRDVDVINDLGNVVAVNTFPFIIEATASYVRRSFPFQLSALGEPTAAPDAAPVDPVTGAFLDGIVTLPTGDVSVSDVADPAGSDFVGASGDIVVSRRPPGGVWTTPETVVGGVGGQSVNDVTVVGGVVVAVGEDVLTNATTGVDEGRAIVLFGDGTTFSRIDLDVGDSNVAVPLNVCAMPDNSALVVGYDARTGLGFTARVDLTTATAQVSAPVIEPTTAVPVACHAAREGAIVEVSIGTGTELYQTRDGVTFVPIDVLADDDSVLRVRTAAQGIAIVGVTGPGGEDAFVLFGPTIDSLQRVDIASFKGAGIQAAYDTVIDDGSLFVVGTINNSPVVWPIVYE